MTSFQYLKKVYFKCRVYWVGVRRGVVVGWLLKMWYHRMAGISCGDGKEWDRLANIMQNAYPKWKFCVHPGRSVECERRRRRRRRTYDDNIIRLTKPRRTNEGYCRDAIQRFDDNSADHFFLVFRILSLLQFFLFWVRLFVAVSKCNMICILFCCMAKCKYGFGYTLCVWMWMCLDGVMSHARVCDISFSSSRCYSYPELANIIKMLIPMHFAFNDEIDDDDGNANDNNRVGMVVGCTIVSGGGEWCAFKMWEYLTDE